MEECHDHLHESHNLPESWIMMFWERGCSSAWTLPNGARTNQLIQWGQTILTQAKCTWVLFYHSGTKASETDCNKTKLPFCIEKDSKMPFHQPLWKAKFGVCSFHCRTLHYGHSRPRKHWTWKLESQKPPKPMTALKQELSLLHSHTYTWAMPLRINQFKLKQKPVFTQQHWMGLYRYQRCSQWYLCDY